MSSTPEPWPRMDGEAGGRTLGTRLFLSQAVVLAASVITAGLVAALVGPPIFHGHLLRAGGSMGSEMQHIEEAFQDASLISLGIALVIALGCALLVTWYITDRIQRPLLELTSAAREMGRGHYGARARVSGAGPELASLAGAFNSMAARLEAMEDTRRRLLSDLAHEMRTPVATISAYLDGLDDGVVVWGSDASGVIRAQTDRLVRLCDDIAEVSRAEEGQVTLDMSTQTVADLVRAAEHASRASYAAKEVTLVADLTGAEGVQVDVDPHRIAQVYANLLSNALRHTPAGGTVTLSVAPGPNEVALVVSDSGAGLTGEQLPHVFERFYRADLARSRESHGSGIGLTIAKAIVDAHGGSLSASSPGPDRGATFTMTLPRTMTPSRSEPTAPADATHRATAATRRPFERGGRH